MQEASLEAGWVSFPPLQWRLTAVPELGLDPTSSPARGEICIRGPLLCDGYHATGAGAPVRPRCACGRLPAACCIAAAGQAPASGWAALGSCMSRSQQARSGAELLVGAGGACERRAGLVLQWRWVLAPQQPPGSAQGEANSACAADIGELTPQGTVRLLDRVDNLRLTASGMCLSSCLRCSSGLWSSTT